MARPVRFMRDCHARYGDQFTVNIAIFGRAVFVCDPDSIKQVFTTNPDALRPGEGNRMLEPVLGRHSLILLDGAAHRRERRLLNPPFHGERMRAYGSIIGSAVQEHTRGWTAGGPADAVQDVFPAMQSVSLDVILRAVFGVEDPARLAQARAPVVGMLEEMRPLALYWPILQQDFGPWGRTMAHRRAVHALVDEEIAERRSRGLEGREDILSLMMSARYEDGQPMSDEALRDEMLTMLLAGHETSTTGLCWAVWELMDHPEVRERLQAELRALPPDATPDTVAASPLLDAVCKETLRLHPVLPVVSRVAAEDLQIGPWEIPAGTGVFPCIWLAHRREATWPEPERFRPDRFLERTPSGYEFLPFGGGSRRCIGMAFALYEMKLVLAGLLRTFDLERGQTTAPSPRRRHITLAPGGGVRVRVLARRTQGEG